MLSNVNGAKSLTSVKLSSLNIAKPCLTTEVFPDEVRNFPEMQNFLLVPPMPYGVRISTSAILVPDSTAACAPPLSADANTSLPLLAVSDGEHTLHCFPPLISNIYIGLFVLISSI